LGRQQTIYNREEGLGDELDLVLTSNWCIVACWSQITRSTQIKNIVCNLIWGGKETRSKVKTLWNIATLPIILGGMGVIDLKFEAQALFTRLLVRGLIPRLKIWKSFVSWKIANF